MIKRLYVDNFKSLNDFEICMSPFTVIVGNNTAGKSTVLQVIDFLAGSVREDFNVVLERRGWTVGDIRSKLYGNRSKMTFECDLLLPVDGKDMAVRWNLTVNVYTTKNIMELVNEDIFLMSEEKKMTLLHFDTAGECYFLCDDGNKERISGISGVQSSFMKFVSISEENKKKYRILVAVKEFLINSDSFELLSPEKMRLSSRGTVTTIGNAGEKLPSFLKSMNADQKKSFMDKVGRIWGKRLTAVEAQTKGQPGWTRIVSTERYKDKSVTITSQNMSDGMLRMLALVAISEINKRQVVMLLDEIENGINMDYAEEMIRILKEVCTEKKNQLIVTTHSATFVDYVDKEDIVYLYKDPVTGFSQGVTLFEVPEFADRLDYLYPGEVLMNMSNKEIIEVLLKIRGER
ncbi:AAA family ATPase [Roseburia hominis]